MNSVLRRALLYTGRGACEIQEIYVLCNDLIFTPSPRLTSFLLFLHLLAEGLFNGVSCFKRGGGGTMSPRRVCALSHIVGKFKNLIY